MRVLVVEDERRMALALQHGLTAEGFSVDVAHDGLAGFAKARTAPMTWWCSTSCCPA